MRENLPLCSCIHTWLPEEHFAVGKWRAKNLRKTGPKFRERAEIRYKTSDACARSYLDRFKILLLRALGEVLAGMGLDLPLVSRAHEHCDGVPVAAAVRLHPAQEILMLFVRPRPRVELRGAGAAVFFANIWTYVQNVCLLVRVAGRCGAGTNVPPL